MAMLRAALYCRLSKDDMLQGDSERDRKSTRLNSITN